jgi:predicted nuclease with RNAse H fold
MRVLGIDLATEPKGTAACWLSFSGQGARAELVAEKLDDAALVRLIAASDRAAIDSPFGWPEPLLEAIARWRDTGTFPTGSREPLRMRATDLYVKERALTPFSVSADKIGALAMRCTMLLTRVAEADHVQVDRVDGKVVECYPSAALYGFGFLRSEVKGAKTDDAVRHGLITAILARAPWLSIDQDTQKTLVEVGDAFDAFIAALIAQAAAVGLTDTPPPARAGLAQVEGWIHLPLSGALGSLAEQRSSASP